MTDKKSHNYFDNLFDKQIDMKFGSCFGMKPHIMSDSYCRNLHKWYYSLNNMILDNVYRKLIDNQLGKMLGIFDY